MTFWPNSLIKCNYRWAWDLPSLKTTRNHSNSLKQATDRWRADDTRVHTFTAIQLESSRAITKNMLCIYKTYVVLLNFHLAFNEVDINSLRKMGKKRNYLKRWQDLFHFSLCCYIRYRSLKSVTRTWPTKNIVRELSFQMVRNERWNHEHYGQ